MNIMIDLETLGIKMDCPIISIGAAAFNNIEIVDTFYIVLDLEEQLDGGRKVNASMLKWWMKQGRDAKKVFEEPTFSVSEGLNLFNSFILKYEGCKVWGNGATFDISILENIFNQYNLKVGWNFRNVRDFRTFMDFNKRVESPRSGVAHNALSDAVSQAMCILNNLRPETRLNNLRPKTKLDNI